MRNAVSVIMANFNMAEFIGHALESIVRQGLSDIQVVIADGQSQDGSANVIGQFASRLPIEVVEVAQAAAPAVGRNAALARARGEFISFLDADDLWPEGKLSRQLDYLSAHPHTGMVSGYVRYFETADQAGLAPAPSTRTVDLIHAHLGACVYRRAVLEEIGAFDEGLRYAEDVDLLLRLRESGIDFAFLRAIALYYRKHPRAMTAQRDPRMDRDFRRAAAKSLQRRRAAGHEGSLPDLSAFIV